MSLQKGDYVLATKYSDGDPKDDWAVGFFDSMTSHDPPRYNVVDADGQLFRGNGYRRAEKITSEQGEFILANNKVIDTSTNSLWWWKKCSETAIGIMSPSDIPSQYELINAQREYINFLETLFPGLLGFCRIHGQSLSAEEEGKLKSFREIIKKIEEGK
jgi:hypothetical protein